MAEVTVRRVLLLGKEGRSRSVGGEVKVMTGHGVSICGELIFTELGT